MIVILIIFQTTFQQKSFFWKSHWRPYFLRFFRSVKSSETKFLPPLGAQHPVGLADKTWELAISTAAAPEEDFANLICISSILKWDFTKVANQIWLFDNKPQTCNIEMQTIYLRFPVPSTVLTILKMLSTLKLSAGAGFSEIEEIWDAQLRKSELLHLTLD